MSTIYVPTRRVTEAELLEALPEMGLARHDDPEEGSDEWAVTDGGDGYLWVGVVGGEARSFARYGRSRPEGVIEAIEAHFDTELVSEHDPRFRGLAGGDSGLLFVEL